MNDQTIPKLAAAETVARAAYNSSLEKLKKVIDEADKDPAVEAAAAVLHDHPRLEYPEYKPALEAFIAAGDKYKAAMNASAAARLAAHDKWKSDSDKADTAFAKDNYEKALAKEKAEEQKTTAVNHQKATTEAAEAAYRAVAAFQQTPNQQTAEAASWACYFAYKTGLKATDAIYRISHDLSEEEEVNISLLMHTLRVAVDLTKGTQKFTKTAEHYRKYSDTPENAPQETAEYLRLSDTCYKTISDMNFVKKAPGTEVDEAAGEAVEAAEKEYREAHSEAQRDPTIIAAVKAEAEAKAKANEYFKKYDDEKEKYYAALNRIPGYTAALEKAEAARKTQRQRIKQ